MAKTICLRWMMLVLSWLRTRVVCTNTTLHIFTVCITDQTKFSVILLDDSVRPGRTEVRRGRGEPRRHSVAVTAPLVSMLLILQGQLGQSVTRRSGNVTRCFYHQNTGKILTFLPSGTNSEELRLEYAIKAVSAILPSAFLWLVIKSFPSILW